MLLKEWLNSQLYRDRPKPTVLERFAELIYINSGSKVVSGWGIIQSGGIYERRGLEQNEALELIYLDGMLTGLLISNNNDTMNYFIEAIQNEINRMEKLKGLIIQ